MKNTNEKMAEVQGAETNKAVIRRIQITEKDIEELQDPKLNSIVRRVLEQSDPNTTGKMIMNIAKGVMKQQELELDV